MIHREVWYKESLREKDLHALLWSHQADPSLETATAVWRAYTRLGRLPPIEYDWVKELASKREDMPEFEVQEEYIAYVVDPEHEMWVPWEEGSYKGILVKLKVWRIVRWLLDKVTYVNLMNGPELVLSSSLPTTDSEKYPFVKISFWPQPTSDVSPYDQTQEDLLLYLHVSDENALQIWEWVRE